MNDNDTLADDLRKDSLALMKLLADEKRKSEALTAELALLSDKACAAVVAYRAALGKLTDGFKYPTEVVTIARNALAHSTEFTSAQSVLR